MAEVLVVVDMQNDFIDGSLGTEEAQSIVGNVVKEMDRGYDLIVCTRDTHGEDYMETNEGRHLPVIHCVKDTEGWKIRKEVEDALEGKKDVRILDKPNFGSYGLVDMLKEYDGMNRIDSITLIGLCTDICVVSNALLLKTAFPEIKISVKKDCCAGVTPGSHDAALVTMKMCQIEIE